MVLEVAGYKQSSKKEPAEVHFDSSSQATVGNKQKGKPREIILQYNQQARMIFGVTASLCTHLPQIFKSEFLY